MIIVIPLGGIGLRFKKHGYKLPKALVRIFGKPIIFWLIENLIIDKNTTVFIPYNKEYLNYRFEDLIRKNFPLINFKFFILENNTRGAAETLNISLKQLDLKDQPIISLDSDNFYLTDIINLWDKKNNCVLTFNDINNEEIYSYVLINKNRQITEIVEKKKISDNACCGGYAFTSFKELIKYTQFIIDNNVKDKDEFYISTVINKMIKDKKVFNSIEISTNKYICLGTPLQLKYFYNNYPKRSSINSCNNLKPLRICFDLDNTLVTFPSVKDDYNTVKPIKENIEYLKYLKSFGNIIIIYTARRMKTHNGNIGKINSDIGKITFDTLCKFDIPYDEIYFGKPHADFYIDDLGLSCFDNLEKEIGFYNNKIEPRDFHSIEISSINTIIKKGNLKGESYYYNNIPRQLKDLFPIFIDGTNEKIIIEKINGITVTDLYLSEMLTKSTFVHILESINRIHNFPISKNEDINLYENYSLKIINRYKNYDYSKFIDSEKNYNFILEKLKQYETKNCGIKKIIHGDPVFSNIIINEYDKIKFIDMRGKIGDKLTICGDWLYDWSKIYQSIIGYDEILLSKNVSNKYKEDIITCFKDYFINKFSEEDFKNLQIITASLIFSLIPLHNNEKCKKYYNLLYSKYISLF